MSKDFLDMFLNLHERLIRAAEKIQNASDIYQNDDEDDGFSVNLVYDSACDCYDDFFNPKNLEQAKENLKFLEKFCKEAIKAKRILKG